MFALAIETIALVFITALVGLVAGFCAGALAGLLTGGRDAADDVMSEGLDAPAVEMAKEAQPVRRIPDPAPPSDLRRRRLLADQPKPDVSS
ncbi:MAG: hypothetical protein AAGF86_12005 [Pseudomonadota bacterium]